MTSDTRAKRPVTRLVAIGDIGNPGQCHAGDDAMMLGLIRAVAASGAPVEWTVMSAEPARSSDQFGVDAVPRVMFEDCVGPDERERRLAEFDAVVAQPPEHWRQIAPPVWRDALAAIAACDAVVIAGGGNLSRSWPYLVFERAAVVRAARRAGRRVVTTGQSIGPTFDERTRELVAEILAACSFVGVRESHSAGVAQDLGVPPERIALQFDDAIGLPGTAPKDASEIVGDGPFIAVTVNRLDDGSEPRGIVPRLAEQLVRLSESTGASVVLVPHVGDLHHRPVDDVAMSTALKAAAGNPSSLRLAPLASPEEAAWYCQQAQLVVSTRYHPVVFALGAGTPVLFMYQDRYTLAKGRGAMELVGLEDWVVPAGLGVMGLLAPAALELWERRETVRKHLDRVRPALQESRRRHVAALLSAVNCEVVPVRVAPIIPLRGPAAYGAWTERACDGLAVAYSSSSVET